ncbi:Hypothetical predicted protein [Pelobates cultripes]|uniref:Uncharacterized protein n=1 Tax=Pelobates cultripes TaxID=61616 RepID=A0AAD1RQX3_PELCU|nr:Hypothetical predicted protein [Pelobates cultripes]
MSDPVVTAFLTKQLCANGGRLPKARVAQYLDLPQEQIEIILQEESLRFPLSGDVVLAQSPIRLCLKYLNGKEEQDDCGKLHLCCSYLRGRCKNGKNQWGQNRTGSISADTGLSQVLGEKRNDPQYKSTDYTWGTCGRRN